MAQARLRRPRRWRECENEYTYANVRLLVQSAIQAGIYPRDVPVDAMAQVMTGMFTHAGVALAEAPPGKRKKLRRDIYTAIQRLLDGLKT